LRAVDAQLELYTLRAPISGRLGAIQVQRGQTLAPGTLVTEVIDLDEIDALCFVTPETASHLHLEQTALILPESSHGDGPILFGEVVYIAVQAHPDTGNLAVKVRFSNKDARDRLLQQAFTFLPGIPFPLPNHNHALRSNSVVTVYVLTEPVDERLSIPDEALLEDHDPPNVIVVQDIKTKEKDKEKEQTGKAKILQARLGVRDRHQHRVEILGLVDPESKKPVALYEDAEKKKPLFFVTEGGHGLKDGDSVKIEEEKEEKEEKE
jgi:multidrug efflux pump subunit AcrA (membrane-fusion protein)